MLLLPTALLSLLSEALNFDFATKGMDEPFTDEEVAGISGMQTMRDRVLQVSGKKNPTPRDFIQATGRGLMRHPTVGRLYGEEGYAVKAAVPRKTLASLLPALRAAGATDLGVAVVGKALGERWRALGEEEKARYKAKAEELAAAAAEAAGDADAADAADAEAAAAPAERPPLPLSLVKKLVCSDPDVRRISAEGLKAVTFATSLFLEMLTGEALDAAQRSGRRTLRFEDLQRAAQNKARTFFLADHLRYVRTTFMTDGAAGGAGGVSIQEALGNAAAAAAQRPPKPPQVGDGGGGGGGARTGTRRPRRRSPRGQPRGPGARASSTRPPPGRSR